MMIGVSSVEPAALVKEYHDLKDTLAAIQKVCQDKCKPYQERMEQIQGEVQKFLLDHKMQNFKTEWGTPYLVTIMNAKVVDREQFLDACEEHWDEFGCDALLASAQKDAVKKWIEAYGQSPPGVEVSYFQRVNIPRS